MYKYLPLVLLVLTGQVSYANDDGVGDCIKPAPEISVDYQECPNQKGLCSGGADD